jgi:uncharacterized protein YecT (DUF1311 family)
MRVFVWCRIGLAFSMIIIGSTVGLSARAASIDCAKAASLVENAICHDAALRRLDARMASAYKRALVGVGYDDESELVQALRFDQKGWLGDRDKCGSAIACLRRVYYRRLAVLNFLPDPEQPSPVDPFVGSFLNGEINLNILRLGGDRVAIYLNGGDLKGRWVCNFQDFGKVVHGKIVISDEVLHAQLTIMAAGKAGVRIAGDKGVFCGVNAPFEGDYFRIPGARNGSN